MKQNVKLIEKNRTKCNVAILVLISDLRHIVCAENKNQEEEYGERKMLKIALKIVKGKNASVSSSFNYPRLFLIMCLQFQKDVNPSSFQEYSYDASFMHTLQKILSLA